MNSDSQGEKCPLCNSGNHKLRNRGIRFADDVDVQTCLDCEIVYLWPQPDEARLNEFYTLEYRSVYGDPTPAERHQEDKAEALQRIDRLKPFLGKRVEALEIGCGSFAFVHNVAAQVAQISGVEMDQATREWFSTIAPIEVYQTLTDIPADRTFDLIVLFHVLEHLSDPVEYLKILAARLNSGGKIIVEVPNVDDALLSVYQIDAFSEFYFSIAHLTYFNLKSLKYCMTMAGLTGEIKGIQRYDLSNHLHWALNNKPGGQAVFSSTISDETNKSYVKDLAMKGQSDTLWGVFNRD